MMHLDNDALACHLRRERGADVVIDRVRELDGADNATTLKAFGYGRPLRVDYRVLVADGEPEGPHSIVLHQVRRNGFGREYDADRFAATWLDFATFSALPRHVPALDILALTSDGQIESAHAVRDFWLVTPFVAGQPYADDLLLWRRRLRDLVGHGEGVLGLTDSYAPDDLRCVRAERIDRARCGA